MSGKLSIVRKLETLDAPEEIVLEYVRGMLKTGDSVYNLSVVADEELTPLFFMALGEDCGTKLAWWKNRPF